MQSSESPVNFENQLNREAIYHVKQGMMPYLLKMSLLVAEHKIPIKCGKYMLFLYLSCISLTVY